MSALNETVPGAQDDSPVMLPESITILYCKGGAKEVQTWEDVEPHVGPLLLGIDEKVVMAATRASCLELCHGDQVTPVVGFQLGRDMQCQPGSLMAASGGLGAQLLGRKTTMEPSSTSQ